jgi:hypothetical protein
MFGSPGEVKEAQIAAILLHVEHGSPEIAENAKDRQKRIARN